MGKQINALVYSLNSGFTNNYTHTIYMHSLKFMNIYLRKRVLTCCLLFKLENINFYQIFQRMKEINFNFWKKLHHLFPFVGHDVFVEKKQKKYLPNLTKQFQLFVLYSILVYTLLSKIKHKVYDE